MDKYIVYIVQGYDAYNKETDLFMNTVNIEVIADSEKNALERAKKIIVKPLYRIIGAYEKKI